MAEQFLAKFFHLAKAMQIRADIMSFALKDLESFYKAWERFKVEDLLVKVGELMFPVDFLILDMEANPTTLIILGSYGNAFPSQIPSLGADCCDENKVPSLIPSLNMEMPESRKWMYNRIGPNRVGITEEFLKGVEDFIEFACQSSSDFQNTGKIRCPCVRCKCTRYHGLDDIRMHLYQKSFQPRYHYWTSHGEEMPNIPRDPAIDVQADAANYYWQSSDRSNFNPYEQMIMDVAGLSIREDLLQEENYNQQFLPEPPNPDVQSFFDMLSAAQAPLWNRCESHSELSVTMKLLSIKADYNIPQGCFDDVVHLMKEKMLADNSMLENFYQAKKSVSKLGLGYQRIDCCIGGCMIYYKNDANLMQCKFCGANRYKPRRTGSENLKDIPVKCMWYLPLIPRLQRLFSSTVTAKEMRWHYEHQSESDLLCHPSDGEVWKYFDRTFEDFASDPRNVRLGLCADGFTPFGQSGKNYSCWPVILTPYNLPPMMCMKREFMFLTIIIPGPHNPKSRIDVYLQPLIDELNQLWCKGVITYDVFMKENFIMRAALMWTINDFPAYGTLSRWMTQGKLACPYCMECSKAFTLKNGRKNSWFDCHRQFLPTTHAFRRNKDEFCKNRLEKSQPPPRLSGEEVLARGKTKDNVKSRLDLSHYCERRALELVEYDNGKSFKPKAQFCLTMEQKRAVCSWRLLPIALRALPEPIWATITELSHFFKDICSTTLRENQLSIIEDNIPVVLCKLERIFPPSFFDSMEHLLVHLPFETRMGGPVQYRWMYPFERFLHSLKKKVKNKARVEGSICEAYIVEETSSFASYYFEPHVSSRRTRVP
ncbi:uncharacterized protein LOC119981859 [Tripterygium wilfordii]|uniref:uncharacterized protein LOC119981859 n=1 Tax=Tripterygium wilfordii TaxID=458696 RepID=UPI0018F82F36|nr:uncharacterized protein LOC119981859 [Tripterygium wilfordii]